MISFPGRGVCGPLQFQEAAWGLVGDSPVANGWWIRESWVVERLPGDDTSRRPGASGYDQRSISVIPGANLTDPPVRVGDTHPR